MYSPIFRPRRLRETETLRRMVRETHLRVDDLVLPFFVVHGRKVRRAIDAMPGVFQLSVDELIKDAGAASIQEIFDASSRFATQASTGRSA